MNQRSYIKFYLNNKLIREYNGKIIGLRISPNSADSLNKRLELLEKLRFEFHKALENGRYPFNEASNTKSEDMKINYPPIEIEIESQLSTIQVLFKVVKSKIRSDLSKKYKRNLKSIYRQFKRFMLLEELNAPISSIPLSRIELFLDQFNSTGTYYMNKRRDLGVLFSSAGRILNQPLDTIQKSQRRKSKATLHKTYDSEQLKPIFNYLKRNYPNLYICCLITYASWLRPHEEIRLLKTSNFRNDFTEIHLSGDENKGGKVRVVYIPDYVRVELKPLIKDLARTANIFSLDSEPFNEFYFNTQWSRAWSKMFQLGLIHEDQTIYSFRHTAAVALYRKTKDVYLLQQLLGHSTIVVTLKYLRNLGAINVSELKDAAPTLE